MARDILPSYLPAASVTFTPKDGGEPKVIYRPYMAFPLADLKRHAIGDETGALLELGRRYYFGALGAEQDYAQAYDYLHRAAELGAQDAISMLAAYYLSDEIPTKQNNPEQGMKLLNAAAEAGSWDAMEKLSIAYRAGGEGIPIDHEKSLEWAENAERMVRVYWVFYTQPDFVDFNEVLRVLLHGHTRITLTLAYHCANGIGTKRDLSEAKRWLDIGESFVCNVTGLKEVPIFQQKRAELSARAEKDAARAKKADKKKK